MNLLPFGLSINLSTVVKCCQCHCQCYPDLKMVRGGPPPRGRGRGLMFRVGHGNEKGGKGAGAGQVRGLVARMVGKVGGAAGVMGKDKERGAVGEPGSLSLTSLILEALRLDSWGPSLLLGFGM